MTSFHALVDRGHSHQKAEKAEKTRSAATALLNHARVLGIGFQFMKALHLAP